MKNENEEKEIDIDLTYLENLTPKQIKKAIIIMMVWGIILLLWVYNKGWI